MSPEFSDDQATQLEFDQGTLVLRGWSLASIQKLFGDSISSLFRWDPRIGSLRCNAYHYAVVAPALAATVWKFHDLAKATAEVGWPKRVIHTPRPEQLAAIDAWSEHQRGLIVMPTGTGKTEVALHLMAKHPCSTLVVAPVRDLMYQWHRRILEAFGCNAGIIGDNTFNVRPVSVTTYDSAAIHMAKLGNQFEFIIFDECHHLPGDFRREAALMSIAPRRLGLSATPTRSDGRHRDLEDLIGPVVYDLPLEQVRGKTLAEFEIVRIPVCLSEAEQARYDRSSEAVRQYMYQRRKADPKFSWQDLCGEAATEPAARQALVSYRNKQAIEDRAEEKLRVIEDLFRLHAGTPIIVFAGSNAMAREISIRFLIPCLLNHCGKQERAEILAGLQGRHYPAIVANQVLDEGVDVPAVKVAIVVGGTASTKQAKQRLGRILRRSGTTKATLYEVVCQDTNEVKRSTRRRSSDAYSGTRHRRI